VWMARTAQHALPAVLSRGTASFMTRLTASKAHLGISFKRLLARSIIPRIALEIEKVQTR